MNILMIYPKFPPTFWNPDHYLPDPPDKPNYTMPPLGLLTIASYLPDDFQIRLIDRNVREETERDWEWADVVFFSLMLAQIQDYRFCLTKARRAGKPVALGGPFTHAMPKEACVDADWVCYGEAETIMEDFIGDLRADRRKRIYHGGNKTNMEEVKIPRFDLLPHINDYTTMPIQFSRGCPFNCEFCDIIEIYGRVPRTKRPSQVLAELDAINHLRFRGAIFIVDDNFIGNKRKAKEMVEELAVWNRIHDFPYLFMTEASINLAHEEPLLEAMARANFFSVFIGIETPDPQLLKMTQKMQNIPGNPLEKLRKIREYGIHIMAGFIMGFDGEDRQVFETQKSFIQASGIGIAMIGLLQAIPHTQLSRRLKNEGRLLENGSMKVITTVEGINFIPKGEITKRDYFENYYRIVQELLKPELFFERICTAALQIRPRLKLRKCLPRHVFSYLNDLLYLTLKAKGIRRYFWKALLNVLWKNPLALGSFLFDCDWYPYLRHHTYFELKRQIFDYLTHPDPGDVLDRVIPMGEAVSVVQL
jgi:radical SAM superfamily enzyme YgiQ (UPF0313 family)